MNLANPADKKLCTKIILSLILLTVVAYGRVLFCGFTNFDDTKYVLYNPHVNTGLTLENLRWAFNIGYSGNWHPLTWISHMLDVSLFGLKPMGHHAVNLALHTLSTIILFVTLNRLTKSTWKSMFVAALFAVHPLHVESVAWVAERKDVLSGLFWMLTMLAYVRYTEQPNPIRYSLVLSTFVLGLMAKPMLVTLPLALLLLDYWPLNRMTVTRGKQSFFNMRILVEKVPLLIISSASCWVTFLAQQRGHAVSTLSLIPVGMRIENSIISLGMYLLKTVWPSGLAPFYPFPMSAIPVWKVVSAGIVVVALSILAYNSRRTKPWITFGWLWYLVTLLPVIGLVQVGAQSMADRYTYIPLIGIFAALAWSFKTKESKPSYRYTILAAGIVAIFSILSWVQIGYWKDSITLFTHTMNVTEDNYAAYANLGAAYADKKDYQQAESYYVRALEYRSDTPTLHYDYANTLYALGKVDSAEKEYEAALNLDPEFEDARQALETIRRKKEYAAQASAILQRASNPSDAVAHMNRAVTLDASGDIAGAEREYRTAIRLKPDFAEAYSNLGVLLRSKNDLDGAIAAYKEAIRIKPNFKQVHMNLAIAYYLKADYTAAWKEVHVCDTLGMNRSDELIRALSEKMPEPNM